jgi:YjjG family noncanonical pyrimidine nucleotidase
MFCGLYSGYIFKKHAAKRLIMVWRSTKAKEMRTTAKYTCLLFDADGTLFDYDAGERQALAQSLDEIGVDYQARYLAEYRRINTAIWQAREQGHIEAERLKVRRFELLFEVLGMAHDPQAFSARYLGNLAQQATLLDQAQQTIQALAGDYQLVLVTNGLKEVQRRRLHKSSIHRYFQDIVVSDEIGAAKPDVGFFEITFQRLGHPPKEEVLMIGDSLTSDIQGANNYGIDACWYNPEGRERDPSLAIRYEIRTLLALIDILDARPGKAHTK